MKSIFKLLILTLLLNANAVFSQGCDIDDPASSSAEGNMPNIKLFGYIQPQYDYNFTDGNQANTIRFKRARLGVRGSVLNDFSYYFMLEASPFIGGTADTYLMDAFITYEADNWARISVGTYCFNVPGFTNLISGAGIGNIPHVFCRNTPSEKSDALSIPAGTSHDASMLVFA